MGTIHFYINQKVEGANTLNQNNQIQENTELEKQERQLKPKI